MTDQNRQFDDLERRPSDRFRKDLRALYEPTGAVPPQIDRTILDQARRRLAKPRRIILRIRWAGGIAAAAAVIALGVFLYQGPTSPNHPSAAIQQSAAAERRADIDGNGRVDILDAFRLARSVESRGPTAADWDINNDGRIDRDDIDAVAFAAVRLSPVSAGRVAPTSSRQPQQYIGPAGERFFVGWASSPDTLGRAGTLVLRRDEPRRTAQSGSSCATRPMSIAAVLSECPMRRLALRNTLDKGV